MRRMSFLVFALILALVLPSCAEKPSNTLTIRVQDSFQHAKGITYDGLTSDTITAYRVIVADGEETIADSGAVSGSEIILTGIAPGTYTFTVQGLIGDIPVAETSSEHAIGSATTLALPLKDIKAGTVADLTITVRSPYTGDYPHTDDSITVAYGDTTTTLSTADGTLTYTGDADGVWTYHAKADALRAGAVTITFRAGGSEPIELTTGGVLFAGVGNVCGFDAEKGEQLIPVTVPMALPDGSVLFYDRGEAYGEYCIGADGYPKRLSSGEDDGSADSGNWRYLICDKSDLDGRKNWGPYGTLEGITNSVIGAGLENTNHMIATYGSDNTYFWYDILTQNKESGLIWFMPSDNELEMMYYKRTDIANMGGDVFKTDTYYWSSSEGTPNSSTFAAVLNFSDGSGARGGKNGYRYCRLVRRI